MRKLALLLIVALVPATALGKRGKRAKTKAKAAAPAPPTDTTPVTVCDPNTQPPLRTVVAGNPPFIVHGDDGKISGISIELWSEVSKKLCRRFEVQTAPNVGAAIDVLTRGDGDIIVAPASITAARSKRVSFSQPYFNAGLSILAPATGTTFEQLQPLMTKAFVTGISALIAILTIVGALIWLAERRTNADEFPPGLFAGIGTGIWLALVTMTSVGYGDRVPRSVAGRFIAGVWMLASILIVSSLTASMATAFTLSQLSAAAISTASELKDRKVGVPEGTTSARFAEAAGARIEAMADVKSAVAALAEGKVEAVVFDRPALKYLSRQHPEWELQLSIATYQPQGYGFATPLDSPLLHEINVALLTLAETGETSAIKVRWLGEDE